MGPGVKGWKEVVKVSSPIYLVRKGSFLKRKVLNFSFRGFLQKNE